MTTPTPTPDAESAPPDPSNDGSIADPPSDADTGKTFTQADIDRVVEQRLARERQKFADYDQVKADAAELAKIRDGEKSELQKLQEQLDSEREARSTAEKEAAAGKRTQYGIDKGLPPALAKKLQSGTNEELDAEIQELLPHIAKPEVKHVVTTSGGLRSGASGSGSSNADPKERAANAIRQLFDR